ncbi:hypothetical protein O3S80_25245 [Streptomyces sp. Lzd4kr]|nr:hypothetical protein [Streptomyces sp. Lzd4kr]
MSIFYSLALLNIMRRWQPRELSSCPACKSLEIEIHQVPNIGRREMTSLKKCAVVAAAALPFLGTTGVANAEDVPFEKSKFAVLYSGASICRSVSLLTTMANSEDPITEIDASYWPNGSNYKATLLHVSQSYWGANGVFKGARDTWTQDVGLPRSSGTVPTWWTGLTNYSAPPDNWSVPDNYVIVKHTFTYKVGQENCYARVERRVQ